MLPGGHAGNCPKDTGNSLDLAGDKLGHGPHIRRFDQDNNIVVSGNRIRRGYAIQRPKGPYDLLYTAHFSFY